MAELKTQENLISLDQFWSEVDEKRLEDSRRLYQIMADITGCEGSVWGKNILGFDRYHYRYKSGRSGEWFITGFSPRKREFSIYIMSGFAQYQDLLPALGKHRVGKSCLYINCLAQIDMSILRQLIGQSVEAMRQKYPA